jgi:tetratricopeptide (TPR) repeat protein
MTDDVFLSHNSKNKPAVEQIARLLTNEYGVSCWLDKWNLVPGEPWQEALEEALEQCKTVAVFVGPNTISPWENEEMRSALEMRAHDKTRRVIPVLLPGAPDSRDLKLPRFLSRLTWVDFRGGLDDKDALYRLYCGIQGIRPGEGNDDTGADRNVGFGLFRKVPAFFQSLRRRRYIQLFVLLLLAFVIAIPWFAYSLPVFCGEQLSTASGLIKLASEQRDKGRYACAIQNLQDAQELEPEPYEQARIYYTFASIYIVKENPDKALEFANHGLEVENVAYDLLHLSKGIAYCQMQQNAEAVQEFDLFLKQTPSPEGLLADNVRDVRDDLERDKDMSVICLVRLGTELMP